MIHEDCTGLVHIKEADADSLCTAIKDVLICCPLPMLRSGLDYDGTSN